MGMSRQLYVGTVVLLASDADVEKAERVVAECECAELGYCEAESAYVCLYDAGAIASIPNKVRVGDLPNPPVSPEFLECVRGVGLEAVYAIVSWVF